MPKILVIEDDEVKRTNVVGVIERQCRPAVIKEAHSVRKAIDILSDEEFDLVVADMSLPTFDIAVRERGGTPRPFGGIEVFDHLERIGSAVPVLVVTSYPVLTDGKKSVSFEDLRHQLKKDFPDNFAEIVYFDFAYTDWERDIQKFLTKMFGRQND